MGLGVPNHGRELLGLFPQDLLEKSIGWAGRDDGSLLINSWDSRGRRYPTELSAVCGTPSTQ